MTLNLDLQRGLVGHWTMDDADTSGGTLYDRSAYNNHANLNGAETTGVTGQVSEAYSFPGGDSTFSQEATIDISNVTLTGSHTLTAWVYFDSGATGASSNLGNAFFGDHTFSGPTFFADHDNTALRFWDENADGAVNLSTGYTADTWIFVAGVKDGTDVRLYKDGSNVTSDTLPSAAASNSTNLFIGGQDSESSFAGDVDDCRFYTRALSVDEINQVMNMRTQRNTYL